MWQKKSSPEGLKVKLLMAINRLEKREKDYSNKEDTARAKAKDDLRNGDERGFRVSSKKLAMLKSQHSAISGMVEMAQSMRDVIDMQNGLKDIVEIGSLLKNYQDQLGIDTKQIEAAVTNIRTSMEKVNAATEMISTTMDTVSSGDIEVTEAQESLRAELMTELETERQDVSPADILASSIGKEKVKNKST